MTPADDLWPGLPYRVKPRGREAFAGLFELLFNRGRGRELLLVFRQGCGTPMRVPASQVEELEPLGRVMPATWDRIEWLRGNA